MSLSTHVLDAARGQPAAGVPVRLEAAAGDGGWTLLAETRTDRDGRARDAFNEAAAAMAGTSAASRGGTYRLVFDTAAYFAEQGVKEFFYPEVVVCFTVADPDAHYHVPLLLSPFAYSTYRGS
jgi:5-hydroxyisourate hydrolase